MPGSSKGRLSWLNPVLSQQRFATYLRSSDKIESRALDLYQWNMKISSGFMVPLHVFEISLRNAVAEAIVAFHGENWPWNEGFHLSLPNTDRPHYSPYRDVMAAIDSCKKNNPEEVIVELKFAFWQSMLTRRHHERIWVPNFQRAFPGAPTDPQVEIQIRNLHKEVGAIRELRNRVAHHEPIFYMPLKEYHAQIHSLVGWRSSDAAEWLRGLDPVPELLKKRPSWLDKKISNDG